jgi:ribosomal protein L17
VHGNMDLRVIEQRCDEMLREAELNRLKKALRATRKRPAISRLASTVAWEFARAGGLIRKLLRTLRNGD